MQGNIVLKAVEVQLASDHFLYNLINCQRRLKTFSDNQGSIEKISKWRNGAYNLDQSFRKISVVVTVENYYHLWSRIKCTGTNELLTPFPKREQISLEGMIFQVIG